MTIDLNRLKGMEKEELINIAQQVNAPYHPNNKPETIVENIINTVMRQSLNHPDKSNDIATQVKQPVFLTQDELEKSFAPIKEKYKAFSTSYDDESRSCVLKYNDGRYRHAETMSMSCSLSKFVRKAHEIAKGPLVVRGLQGDWSKLGGVNPNNIYTETVLAG